MTRSVPWAQAGLAACAFAAAVAYGAPWLGLDVAYEVRVDSSEFTLGPDYPLGLLAAMVMGAAASLVRTHGRAPAAAAALSFGAGAIVASSLYVLLVWAPSGAPPGQLELLKDASRLGFALLALALPFALPPGAPALARLGTLACGALLAPVLLFPHHVEAAGAADVHTTLPMLLFFLQGLLAMSGTAHISAARGWGRRRKHAEHDPEVAVLRGRATRGKPAKASKARRVLRFEALRGDLHPNRPEGPEGPGAPPPRAAKRTAWFYQF